MKALTLKHPWPWAICRLGKRIENRTWKPPAKALSVGDWLGIHGGRWPDSRSAEEEVYEEAWDLFLEHDPGGLDEEEVYANCRRCVGIVAVAEFAGCLTYSPDPWFEGPVGWLLSDLVVLPEPVPCKGAQGLWELPPDVLAKVREQFRAARRKEAAGA